MRSRSSLALAIGALLTLMLSAPAAHAEEPAPTETDALDPLRERFRAGLEKYRAGAFAEALVIWQAIYRDLGPERGYRLSFNIARAYEQYGDSTRAAESYEAYVKEVSRRRDAGETLEPLVEKQEVEAKERLAELAATQGRIRITGDRAVLVKIGASAERLVPRSGLVSYVTPGAVHVVVFNPGTPSETRVPIAVGLGEMVELEAPKALAPAQVVPPAVRYEMREERPFTRTVLFVAAGITVLSVAVPAIFYSRAGVLADEYDAASSRDDKIRLSADYETARSNAYASLAIPAVLGAATIGLGAWWLFGRSETRIPVQAAFVPGGATLGATTTF